MIIFFDTSSFIKRYILEKSSDKVDGYFFKADQIILSPITKIEINSALKRRLTEKAFSAEDYIQYINEINYDYENFKIISMTKIVEKKAIFLIRKYQTKTLDSIQLASAGISNADLFLTSDEKLFKCASDYLPFKCEYI